MATPFLIAETALHSVSPIQMPFTYQKNEEGLFVCPDCGVTKNRQNSMHYHMKKHLEELQHVCKSCKKGFLQKQTLDLHIRSKHPELVDTVNKKHSCPFDDCKFHALTKGNLVIHVLRLHFQEEIGEIMIYDQERKVTTCYECEKEFSSSCGFYYHCKGCIAFDTSDDKYKTVKELLA